MPDEEQIKIIAENIKKYLKEKNMTQTELASRVGVSKSTMSDYLALRSKPSHGVLEKIANVFSVGKSDIDTTYQDSLMMEELKRKQRKDKLFKLLEDPQPYDVALVNLKIVGKISCGKGVLAYEEIEGAEPTPRSWLNGGDYFYLRAKGQSMVDAGIEEGDLLLIREQEDVESGEIAAVYLDGKAVLKRVIKNENGSITLRSENSNHKAYPPMTFSSGNIWIIGKLKKSIKSY